MTEDSIFHENSQRPLPLAQQVDELFAAASELNQENFGMLGGVLQSMKREDAISALIDQGVDEQTAINNVALIEDSDEPGAFDRGIFGLLHGQTLEAAGLAVGSETAYLGIVISDAARFAEALDASQLDEVQRTSLANTATAYISGQLASLQDRESKVQEEGITAILGNDVPEWWWFDDYDGKPQPADQVQSNQQLLGGAGILANRLESIGGDPDVAQNLRNVAEFVKEGDLLPWVVARGLGIAPAKKDELYGSDNPWRYWSTAEEWTPAFKVIEASRRGGAFEKYLINSVRTIVEQTTIDHQDSINRSLEDYIAEHREWEASRSAKEHEENADGGIISPESDESLHVYYDIMQRDAQNLLPELQKVLERLATYS